MAQLFARVELRGTPGEAVYEKLHAHLEKLYWYRWIKGGAQVGLPHAMYQATVDGTPDVVGIAANLKASIQANVWANALILVVQSSNWAQSG
jgi:hypothetical protein